MYYKVYVPSNDVLINHAAEETTFDTESSWVKLIEFTLTGKIGAASQFRYKFDIKGDGLGFPVEGQIWRNGTPIGSIQWMNGAAIYTTFTEDINNTNWVQGDKVQLYGNTLLTVSAVYVRNFQILGLGSEWS